MAKDGGKPEVEGVNESEELQRMLGEAGQAEAQSKSVVKQLIATIKKNKLIAIGAVVFVFLGVIASFIFSESEKIEEEQNEIALPEISEEKAPEEGPKILNANVYKLEPFFLPLKAVGDDPDRFVNVSLYFVLSNRKMDAELDKNIRTIRENIYNLLKRKKPKEYIRYKLRIKERLKREIVTVSNSLLASGSGTIQDVLFTDFVVK